MRRLVPLVFLAFVSCILPARSFGAYEGKAVSTAQDMLSAVETARMTVEGVARRKTFAPFVSVSLAEADRDAGAVQGAFDSIQPPDARADELRSDLDDLLDQAASILADLRIAARRTDRAQLIKLARPLPGLALKLMKFVEAHQ